MKNSPIVFDHIDGRGKEMRNLIDIEFDIDTAEDLMREAETDEDRAECYKWRQDLKHELMVTVYRMKRKDF